MTKKQKDNKEKKFILIRDLYAHNNILFWIFSVALCLSFLLSISIAVDIWPNLVQLFSILLTIFIAFVTAYIFYVFQVYLPYAKSKEKISFYLGRRLRFLANDAFMPVWYVLKEDTNWVKNPNFITQSMIKKNFNELVNSYETNKSPNMISYRSGGKLCSDGSCEYDEITKEFIMYALRIKKDATGFLSFYSNYVDAEQLKLLEKLISAPFVLEFSQLYEEKGWQHSGSDISDLIFEMYQLHDALQIQANKYIQ